VNCRLLQSLVLTVVLGASLLGACGPATTSWDDARVSDAAGARDAVVAYLVEHYGEQGPSPDLSGTETRTTVVIGKTKVEYAADTERGSADWEVWISYPVVAREVLAYEAMVFWRTGF
jgi:hypothetical protein